MTKKDVTVMTVPTMLPYILAHSTVKMLKFLISAFSGLGYRSVPKYPFLRFHFRTVKPTCRAYGYVTNKYLYFIFTWLNFSLTLRRYFNNLIHTLTNELVLKLSLLPSRITSSHFQKSKKMVLHIK